MLEKVAGTKKAGHALSEKAVVAVEAAVAVDAVASAVEAVAFVVASW